VSTPSAVQLDELDVLDQITDESVYFTPGVDYEDANSLTYSAVVARETSSNTAFLPGYIVVTDSTGDVHGLLLNWSLISTEAAVGGVVYNYTAVATGLANAAGEIKGILTSGAVLAGMTDFQKQIADGLEFAMDITVLDRQALTLPVAAD
jgi:hypothetical protein